MTTMTKEEAVRALIPWVEAVTEALDLDEDAIHIGDVLDLNEVVATRVARPAGPVSAYAAGYAQALFDMDKVIDPTKTVPDAAAKITAMARGWQWNDDAANQATADVQD